MRRFLYYLPNVPGANAAMLSARGLLSRFTSRGSDLIEYGVTGINDGPAGLGCIVAAGSQPPNLTADTRWIEGPQFWTAIETLPPRPKDLLREVGISGYDTVLADGNAWRVPLVHEWDEQQVRHVVKLPRSITHVREGAGFRSSVQVRAEYAPLDVLATRIFQSFVDQATVTMDGLFADAIQLLAVNYRLGIEEASLIGLLDEESALRVLRRAIDADRIAAQGELLSVDGLDLREPVIEDEE